MRAKFMDRLLIEAIGVMLSGLFKPIYRLEDPISLCIGESR